MKLYIKSILLILMMAFIVSCEERIEAENFEMSKEGAVPVITPGESTFFNLTNLNTAAVDFSVDLLGSADVVRVYKNFNGGDFIQIAELTSFPVDFVVTVDDAIDGIAGVTKDQLKPGDVFNFTFEVESNGKTYQTSTVVAATAACPSAVSTENDTWSVTGTNNYTGSSSATGIKITPLGGGDYLISDISAGFYASLGFSDMQEGIYNDVCNTFSWVKRGGNSQFAFADPGIKGSYDPVNEVLVIHWYDELNGITGTSTYTKD